MRAVRQVGALGGVSPRGRDSTSEPEADAGVSHSAATRQAGHRNGRRGSGGVCGAHSRPLVSEGMQA